MPRRGFGLALAPAMALSVFVALVFVDAAGITRTDESGDAFTAATMRQADDAIATGDAAPALPEPELRTLTEGAEAEPEAAPGAAPDLASSGEAAEPEPAMAPSTMDSDAVEPPEDAEVAIAAPEEDGEDPAPAGFDAPASDDGGLSTIRVLQIAAGAAFLVSGFYVFVRPRIARGGS